MQKENPMRTEVTTFGTGKSATIDHCQSCGSKKLDPFLFLGYMPPVNQFRKIGEIPSEQPAYPAQVLYCEDCHLVQLGTVVDPQVLFPKEYPYTSSTTKILRDNFAELSREVSDVVGIKKDDLIVDIGSNDGNLLSNFKDLCRVQGVTPEDIGKIAIERGIPTIQNYFSAAVVDQIVSKQGKAKFVTATNVFAHIENVNDITKAITNLLADDGVFISESHYLLPLIETLQFDTIYHEHLRYYSLHSLKSLLERHGLEVFHAKEIPTHGGSVRVYAGRKGKHKVRDTVTTQLTKEKSTVIGKDNLNQFRKRVAQSKLACMALLNEVKSKGARVFAISAPSRATTLCNFYGIDDGVLDMICEIKGSYKIGKYMPGTLIEVQPEERLYQEQPEYAMLLSWHIADELIPKIKANGYKGKFIVPLPEPRIVG
jgi:hypothetical protein